MKNQTLLLRKLFTDMRMNRGGFLAVWLTFTVGIIFYNATYPAGSNLMKSISHFYDEMHLAELWYGFTAAPVAIVQQVRAIDGVDNATGRIVIETGLEQSGAPSLTTLRLISLPTSPDDLNNVVLLTGRLPAHENEIVLTNAFAQTQGIKTGATLRLTGTTSEQAWEVTVVGTVISSEYLIGSRSQMQPFPTLSTFGVGYALETVLATHANLSGKINSLVVTIKNSADEATVREAVARQLKPYTLQLVMDRRQQPAFATLNANAGSNTQVALIFSLIFLFGSGAVMAILLARQVDSERRIIGTLRALGYSRVQVMAYYLTFAVLLAVVGIVVGVPLGYLITGPIMRFFQLGLIGEVIPFFTNPPNWTFIALGAGAGLIMALIAAAVPAWRAATTDPGLALRPPTPAGIPGFAQLRLNRLALINKLALRNLLRVPTRTLGTSLGVACGLMIVLLCFATWNVIDYNFTAFYQSRQFDYVLTISDIKGQSTLHDQIKQVDGVIAVETGLVAPINVQLKDRSYTALGMVLDDQRSLITFDTLQGVPAFSTAEGIWLGHNLARTIEAKPGDILTITVQGISKQVKVEGIVKQVVGAPLYVPMSLFSQWTPFNVRLANQAYVRVDPTRRLAIQQTLNRLPGVIGVEDWRSTVQDIQHVADFNGNFAIIFLQFGIFLTFVVLFTTVYANLRERREELSIMRIQGLSMGEIWRLVTAETVCAILIGLLVGIPVAKALVEYVMQLYNTDVAGNLSIIYLPSWIIAITLVTATALSAQILPIRSLRQINLGDMSKSVSA